MFVQSARSHIGRLAYMPKGTQACNSEPPLIHLRPPSSDNEAAPLLFLLLQYWPFTSHIFCNSILTKILSLLWARWDSLIGLVYFFLYSWLLHRQWEVPKSAFAVFQHLDHPHAWAKCWKTLEWQSIYIYCIWVTPFVLHSTHARASISCNLTYWWVMMNDKY